MTRSVVNVLMTKSYIVFYVPPLLSSLISTPERHSKTKNTLKLFRASSLEYVQSTSSFLFLPEKDQGSSCDSPYNH